MLAVGTYLFGMYHTQVYADLVTTRDELEAVPDPGGTAAAGERAPEQVVAAFFDAFGRHDVEAIRRLLTDDIVEELSGTSPIAGIENECAFLTALFAAFPDMQVDVTRLMAVGQLVAVEWTRRGTFAGDDFQGLPANGARIDSPAAGFFEIAGSLIKRITVYADMNKFGRDLGLVPAEGSMAERLALAMFRGRVRVQRAASTLRRGQRAVG
jgi:steroid delta-isomerase-like uncharacterized protein